MKVKDKKGSSAVFLTMILTAMLAATMAFLYAANAIAETSRNDAVLRLSARSVLAEFSRELKDDYGIFAFYGFPQEVEGKLLFYMKGNMGRIRLTKGPLVMLGPHSLINVDAFEEELINDVKFRAAEGLSHGEWQGAAKGQNGGSVQRDLRNESIIQDLPSSGFTSEGIDLDNLTSKAKNWKDILRGGADKLLIDKYALEYFKHRFNQDDTKQTFFQNEVEYLLYGYQSDKSNQNRFKNDFIKLRTALNLIHIYSDPQKRAESLAVAELINPAAALVAQGLLCGAWALAEAVNDAKLLLSGGNVMLIKTPEEWALNLDSVVSDSLGKGYIAPGSERGIPYEEYVRIFLYFQDRETKLARMMDLIQINMKLRYRADFEIRDYNTGLSFEVTLGDKRYEYTEKY